jgi:hypothetical protein
MKKYSKPNEHQPLHQGGAQTPKPASPTSPSIDAKGRPVAENDNSANLFEDHIKQQENKDHC